MENQIQDEIIVDVNVVNLTPHDINIYDENENFIVTVPRSGTVARATATTTRTGRTLRFVNLGNAKVPENKTDYGAPIDLPNPQGNNIYIISALTAKAAETHGRSMDDLKVPGQGIRDEHGVIFGCKEICAL